MLPRFMHVAGVGWIDCRPSEWEFDRIVGPAPLPVHVDDPEAERERVAARVAERMRVEPLWPGYPVWPAPEIPMRVIEAGAVPGAPARLLSKLRSADWRVVVTYARGTTFDAQRRPGRVLDSYALRSASGNRRAIPIWTGSPGGKLTSGGVLLFGDRPTQWIGLREFEREI